jgi:methylmalonyl-CoA mutase N-terminal domain/subunit
VVGVNRYADAPHGGSGDGANESQARSDEAPKGRSRIPTLQIDPTMEARQIERVRQVRATRDHAAWRDALDAVSAAARGTDNLVPPIVRAVEAHATIGEISDAMRAVFGEHKEIDA